MMKNVVLFTLGILLFSACSKSPCEAILSGTVIDSFTGEPIKDALIDFREGAYINNPRNKINVANVYTNAEGKFEMLTDLELTIWDVKVERAGYEVDLFQTSTKSCSEAHSKIELDPYAFVHVTTYDEYYKHSEQVVLSGNVGLIPDGHVKRAELRLDESAKIAVRSGSAGELAIYENNFNGAKTVVKFDIPPGETDTLRIGL